MSIVNFSVNQLYQQQLNKSNNIPSGSCHINTYQHLQKHKSILNNSLAQSLIFPYHPIYNSWVIVKQIQSGQQPIYHLYYQIFKKRFLSAQKQSNNIGCNYLISKKQKPKKDEYFVGKVRGNFRNTQFFVYDGGQNPKKKCVRKRKQLAFLRLNEDSIFNQSGKQKLQIIVPQIDRQQQDSEGSPKLYPLNLIPKDQKQNILVDKGNKRNSTNIIKIQQKQTVKQQNSQQIWSLYFPNQDSNKQKLNIKFKMNENQKDQQVLILSSRSRNTYSLNFGYPLNMVQSFGIALALIQRANQ